MPTPPSSPRSTRDFGSSPCGAEPPPESFSLVDEKYPQAECASFTPKLLPLRSHGPHKSRQGTAATRNRPKLRSASPNHSSESGFRKPGEISGLAEPAELAGAKGVLKVRWFEDW